jgi:SHS2 domain-containing protein
MRKWQQLEHTSDLFLMGEGDTREEALMGLLEGLAEQIYEPGTVAPAEAKTVSSKGVDTEDAVITLLGEFLYLVYVRNWLPARFETAILSPGSVSVSVRGEKFDPSRHSFLTELKAATFHGYDFSRGDDGLWRVRVLFDR